MIEVCTTSGPRWVALAQVPQAAPAPAGQAGDIGLDSLDGRESSGLPQHCPFCLPSNERAALALHLFIHLFAVLKDDGETALGQAFLFFNHFAIAAPPRGPPGATA
jgi:hypothetical protein